LKRANQIRGLYSKRAGAAFERQFISTARIQGCKVTEIKTNCEVLSCRGAMATVRLLKSPYDICLHFQGKSAFIDMKVRDSERFTFSDIDQHQVSCLEDAAHGGAAGYVVKLLTGVAFFPVAKLKELRPHQGFSITDGIILGDHNWFGVRRIFEGTKV
jgi:penicillin-binding protein-related factor A (putative recombinase)